MFRSAFLFSVRSILNVTGNYAVSFLLAGFPCVSASLHSGLLLLNLFVSVFPPFALCLPFFALLFLPFFLSFPLSFPFCFSCFSFCLFFSSLAIRNPFAYADKFRKEEGRGFCFCLCVCLRFCISLFFICVFVCFPVCLLCPVL